jgi:phosphatidylglycerol lysyltransferase
MTTVAEVRKGSTSLVYRLFGVVQRYGLYLWVAALPVLTAVVVVRRRDELGQIVAAVREANRGWLVAGVVVEALILVAIALMYRAVMRRLGYGLTWPVLLGAHLQRTGVGAISPLSGPTSVYVFVNCVKRHGVSTDDGLLTVALRSIAAQAGFVVLFVAALVATGSRYAALGLVGFVGVLGIVMVVPRLRIAGAIGSWDWTRRLPRWTRSRSEQFVRRARRHELAPRDLGWPVVFAVASRVGALGLLFASLQALHAPAPVGVVVMAYCAAMIACFAVPVFQGAGVVETAAAVALTHGGVEAQTAVGAVLLWRLLEYWLPVGLGLMLQIWSVAARWSLPSVQSVPRGGGSRALPAVAAASSVAVRRGYHAKR